MSAVIRSVLTPLIKLWLRSQVESVKSLEVAITGSDREILQGLIPSAKVAATGVVYQGLHLSNLALTSSQIYLNTPQVLKREALKLLEPIQVNLELQLTPTDLKHCLQASLLEEALGKNFTGITEDQEILASLTEILKKLGDEFKLNDLSIINGHCHCEGIFMVRAT
jgi:hypothetical protein